MFDLGGGKAPMSEDNTIRWSELKYVLDQSLDVRQAKVYVIVISICCCIRLCVMNQS